MLTCLPFLLVFVAASAKEHRELTLLKGGQTSRILQRDLIQTRQSVIGFADPEVCYPALSNADSDGDRLVSSDEYVSFCQSMGPPDFLSGISDFEDLPILLQANFNSLACLCQTDPDKDSCCLGDNASIKADGAFPNEVPSDAEESYLFIVCSLTTNSVDRILLSDSPTPGPTIEPTSAPINPPTISPTTSPTEDPETISPTTSPGSPTVAPTSAPTGTPTITATPTETRVPVEVPVSISYDIGVRPGGEEEMYISDLVVAMDALAPGILADVLTDNPVRRVLRRRRLQSIQFPTSARVAQSIGTSSQGISW